MEKKLTVDEQRLVLETKIAERALIVYVTESAIFDEAFPEEYQKALEDEVKNHNLIIEEYKQELEQLSKTQP